MVTKEKMKSALDGMFWENHWDFHLPRVATPQKAIIALEQVKTQITRDLLWLFESNRANSNQVNTIISEGVTVSGLSVDETLEVYAYGKGLEKLRSMLKDGSFSLTTQTLRELHEAVTEETENNRGAFRNTMIRIHDLEGFIPPVPKTLPETLRKGLEFLNNDIASPEERAMAAFLFIIRSQFFNNHNKRTASLVMNGILAKECRLPLTISSDTGLFFKLLGDFYLSGNATHLMRLIAGNLSEAQFFGDTKEDPTDRPV